MLDGTPGVAVTPLVAGAAVGPGNPLPVQLSSGSNVLFGVFTPTASGDNTALASPGAVKIRVLSYSFDFNGNTRDAQWFSDPAGTAISDKGTGVLGANDQAPAGLFETLASEDLVLNVSAATAGATGRFSYILVT